MQWNSFDELFEHLNNTCNYLVLRNYENYKEDDWLKDHGDVDLLCDDIEHLYEEARAFSNPHDHVHASVDIAGSSKRIDIRYIGDNYYDSKWEQSMLLNRKMGPYGFYVLDMEDYYYSLCYHEVYHKKELRDDYIVKLSSIADDLGISFSPETVKAQLDSYMTDKGYIETGYRSK
ncbi:hypothetical protein [Butyrivibrio sp. MC2013]|uniref:hypothetical protein n=1 Tax=Butyrivibrio sp. MC2013 TaxID=1280686 RepID=UPI00047BE94F|nr:hypothetical protein [Butyrivibrio sp. MC2013]